VTPDKGETVQPDGALKPQTGYSAVMGYIGVGLTGLGNLLFFRKKKEDEE